MSETNVTPSSHALLAPSGAVTWINCPGSVEAQAGMPDKSSEFAAEGTAAHELAARCLSEERVPTEKLGQTINVEEEDATYTFTVTREMTDNVQAYIDYCQTLTAGTEAIKAVEQKVYTDIDECSGTADFLAYNPAEKHLHVVDLKYGKGVRVEVKDNLQAIIYAWGAGRGIFKSTQEFPQLITLHIFQPRINNVSSHTYTLDEIAPFIDRIRKGAEAALQPGAARVPGEKQCQWCKAKPTCPELGRFVDDTVTHAFPDLTGMTNTAVAEAMARVDVVKAWVGAVEAKCHEMLSHGLEVPGFKLVAGRSLRKWGQKEDAVLAALKKRKLLVRDLVEQKLKTVAQLEKSLGREVFANKVADLVIKPEGKPTVAKAEDGRPAINPLDQFEDISNESNAA